MSRSQAEDPKILEPPQSPPSGPYLSDCGDDDVASNYSSEFDRYCSANSAFGYSTCSSFRSVAISPTFKGKSVNIGSDNDSELSSGFDSGEEETRVRFVNRKNLGGESGRIVEESGSSLLMNSAVAFGAGDWDEFERETGGEGLEGLGLFDKDSKDSNFVEKDSNFAGFDGNGSSRGVEVEELETRSFGLFEQEKDSSFAGFDAREVEVEELETRSFGLFEQENDSNFAGFDANGSSRTREVEGEPAGMEKRVSRLEESVLGGKDLNFAYFDGNGSYRAVEGEGEVEFTVTPLCNGIFEQSFNALNRAFLREGGDAGELGLEGIAGVGNLESVEVFREEFLDEEEKKQEASDSYDEMVLEMEEILLNSDNSPGARSTITNGPSTIHQSHHIRDGSSTASTSGTDDVYPHTQYPHKIDGVEVIGAKQKKGDVSFGERLVGVKEYTIYKLRVWSGEDQWEVERRYRDFFALYRQLTTLFTELGLSLPSSWSKVEWESRKIFGNASPNVISDRSILIQDCLRSILNSNYPFETPTSLVQFLSPGQFIHNSGSGSLLKSLVQNANLLRSSSSKDVSVLGKTISLVVEIKPRKSMRQLLEAQHYACTGCHRNLDAGKTLMREIVQTFGWNKPRFCEYTGQLFCALCHTNDTAVLPARVLHHWDFSLYPVSQLAKAYLDSIREQPMLCVSAVNPFLFPKVPALLHVMGVRKKIGAMLPYIRCPFKRSVKKSLGIRRYLLESNDFFALRDLIDFSKGAFAALPAMLETISSKILVHIIEQCLVCYDSGIPCSARQDCDNPASLIFPFQEAEAVKCPTCGSIFHKPCFVKLMGCCPRCKPTVGVRRVSAGSTDRPIVPSGSSFSSGFISDIFSTARPDKLMRPKNNSSPVILMSSLPGTSL